jgi:hypothetical protein
LEFSEFFDWPAIKTNGKTQKKLALNKFLGMNEPEEQEFSFTPRNMLKAKFLSSSLVLIAGQLKKSENSKKRKQA